MGSVTPVEFLSACLPVFKTQPGEATCGGAPGAAGTADADAYAELLGVVCMDLSILADLSELKKEAEWDSWYQSNVVDASCACPETTLNHVQMQAVRASIPGAQQCTADHAVYDNTARRHTGRASTCGDGIEPVNGPVTCGVKTGVLIAIVVAVVVGCCLSGFVTVKCCRGCKTTKASTPAQGVAEVTAAQPSAPPAYRNSMIYASVPRLTDPHQKHSRDACSLCGHCNRLRAVAVVVGGGVPTGQPQVVVVEALPVAGSDGKGAASYP